MKNKKILLLFAHPSQHRSEVNAEMFKLATSLDFVTAVDLYAEYPRFNIDIDKEQQRLISHDIVIFQFPLYWYSTPAILKEWQDLVLEYDFAYGTGGEALLGKTFLCAITAGGKKEAYCAQGYNHFNLRELLQPLEQTATLTGMKYLPPFALYSSRSATVENRLDLHLTQWQNLLHALHQDKMSTDDTKTLITLNSGYQELLNTNPVTKTTNKEAL
jgi:putative NADPH-quinone reductase